MTDYRPAIRGALRQLRRSPGGLPGTAEPVAVLSHDLWQQRFGGDRAVIGKLVQLDGGVLRIVGVLPAGFELVLPAGSGVATDIDVWTGVRSPLADLRRTDGRLRDQDSDNAGAAANRIVAGRAFTRDEDLAEDDRIAIVDQRIVTLIRPDGNALDATISFPLDGRVVQARIVAVLVVLAAATLASVLPARRAARIDPVRVLRSD